MFNIPIETYIGSREGSSAITFNIFVGFYGNAMAVLGPQIERWGPKKSVQLATGMYLAGMLLSALSVYLKSIYALYVAQGIITAIPMGVMYIAPVSPSQKWFPEIRGVVSGLAVCGTGGGSMIASKLINFLIKKYDVPITMVIIGCMYAAIMGVCSLILRTPPEGYSVPGYEDPRQVAESDQPEGETVKMEKENEATFPSADAVELPNEYVKV